VLVGEEAFEACRQLAAHDEVGGHG
jgi:hypothetical protein